ncbi:MAG: ABC superfamily ATP binding cassette transporter, ABC protein [Candidatus Pacebacteria bacterium GW2011_GWF2_38_9]|nr:MAG: ABC transporter ATP-binding protein, putative ABC transport system ATP-binding protein [candidate division TM6 bacterium GW2011_GWF2_28_16]KKQ08581.1 MAG: ABC superfamily ATP binding cassette transporter, ABC protein [Candidatus Pacebacteria bacterium GW2011_GWF1_36_5]KKQ89191.1 MAG: ABC superfamily ATP binding cassette transporter, ABC protein [Candidatus Pacebacteria bacterium GW2011_GWF2_38_9]MBU1034144.1 ABC transporter ATP-binding protein [Patescibacteria group bacterium]HAZ73762.1
MAEQILKLTEIHKSFNLGTQETQIIKGAGFSVNKGDFLILFGPSGCGKSTMLNILLGLEPPTKGEVIFLGKNIYDAFDEDGRAQMRKQQVGIIYQQSNWVKSLNVIENVYFPLTLRGLPEEEREKRAMEVLKMVGMEQGALQNPAELSSGQQQRVSLARALISDPALIVADEPTGNLDSKASEDIMALFKQSNDKGKTVIMVTHDLEYLKFASRSVNMADGVVVGEYSANDERLKKLSVSKRGNIGRAEKS